MLHFVRGKKIAYGLLGQRLYLGARSSWVEPICHVAKSVPLDETENINLIEFAVKSVWPTNGVVGSTQALSTPRVV